ncbi:MAG: Spx/MgsR family RNA polymerase-binding regulatory protein [Helicobacter sp.]|uniref:Spx/MgsR family RNA polymerase-binding regulatory protein n=1 Tax=Helicobacter sp. TaxID=218 RepID=UPI002A916845|nr:Spx/MgsR family RNA polymerase-binding regulatory protein [Helicobacter sp.]MDY5823123.1 Spx/MgsR family RNA polymerase-binding regulatory protein [Helicobacter sp.]
MELIIYGIKNCNSMKKAFAFLDENDIAYRFHDFKKERLDLESLKAILECISLENLINTKGTTYKKLKEQGIKDITPEVVLQNLSVIKRPLIVSYENGVIQKVTIGLQHLEELL